jgi:hypothetical protein
MDAKMNGFMAWIEKENTPLPGDLHTSFLPFSPPEEEA